jgi:hypothetical protein
VPRPSLKTACGKGYGLAACPALGLLVTSDCEDNTLSVWDLQVGTSGSDAFGVAGASAGAGAASGGASAGGGGGLRLVCTLGGAGSVTPMQFKFNGLTTGYLAFTPPTTTTTCGSSSGGQPLLLVTDARHDAVHVVDVVGRTHVGYLASPGSVAGPRGVAASGASPLAAVSAWKTYNSGDHVVMVYRGSGAAWEAVRVIGCGFLAPGSRDGQLFAPVGLRFSGDGSVICVVEYGNDRASVFRVGDGGFVRHMATGLSLPMDVEEVDGPPWARLVVGMASGTGSSSTLPLWRLCLAWGWWCGSGVTVACRCSPHPTQLPWRTCRLTVWHGWWPWHGLFCVARRRLLLHVQGPGPHGVLLSGGRQNVPRPVFPFCGLLPCLHWAACGVGAGGGQHVA